MSDQVSSVSRCPDSAASGCAPRCAPNAYLEQGDSDALSARLQPLWDELQRLKTKINAFGSLLEGQRGQCEQGQRDLTRAFRGLRVQLGAARIDPSDDIGILLAPGRGEQADGEAGSEAGDLSGDEAECGETAIKGNPCVDAYSNAAAGQAHCQVDQLPLFRKHLLNIRQSIEERPWPSPCRTAATPHGTLEETESQSAEHKSLPQVGTPPIALPQEEMLKLAEQPLPQDEEPRHDVVQPTFLEQREATQVASIITSGAKMMAPDAGNSFSEAMDRARDELRQMAVEECLRAATDFQDVLQEVSFEVVESTLQQHKAEIEAEVLAWLNQEAAEWRQEWLKELKQEIADLKESMSLKGEMPEPCPEQACDGPDIPLHAGRMSSLASELCDLRAEAKVNADERKLVASRVELLERQMTLGRENGRWRTSTAQTSDHGARRATVRTPSSCGSRLSERLRVRSAGRVPVPRIFCLSMPRASSPP